MNYDNTLYKMSSAYEEVSPEVVKRIWSKNISQEVGVYIHSPFCPSVCKYCAYKGTLVNDYIDSYYSLYLPQQLDFYKEIIDSNKVITWFFGGGTPSLMNATTLRNILEKIPKIKEKAEKTFEVHPARYDPEIFDVLKEYDFTHIIVGVQSFDEKTLINQNRLPASFETVSDIVNEIHDRNMNAWIDLIGFMNGDDERDAQIYTNDLRMAMLLNPEEISAQLNYNVRTSERIDKNVELFYKLLSKPGNERWVLEFFDPSKNQEITKDLLKNVLLDFKGVRLFNKNKFIHRDQRRFVESFVEENAAELQGRPSALAIGSFQNPLHGTMSRVHTKDRIYIYTETNKNNTEPRYFVTHTPEFAEEFKKILYDLKEITKEFAGEYELTELQVQNGYQEFSTDENNLDQKGYGIGDRISGLSFGVNWRVTGKNTNGVVLSNKIIKYCKEYRGKKPYINLSDVL